MKRLAYLLMALSLVFFVSCNKNSGQGDAAVAESSKYSGNTEVAKKWEGSPAYVEYMTFLDGFEGKVKKCKSCDELEDILDVLDEKIEVLGEKYPDFEPEGEEEQQMEQRSMDLMKLIFEQGKEMDCGGMVEDIDDMCSNIELEYVD